MLFDSKRGHILPYVDIGMSFQRTAYNIKRYLTVILDILQIPIMWENQLEEREFFRIHPKVCLYTRSHIKRWHKKIGSPIKMLPSLCPIIRVIETPGILKYVKLYRCLRLTFRNTNFSSIIQGKYLKQQTRWSKIVLRDETHFNFDYSNGFIFSWPSKRKEHIFHVSIRSLIVWAAFPQ